MSIPIPDNAEAISKQAGESIDAQRFEEAVACYDRALEINPRLASARYNEGDELAWMCNFSAAITCFEKARDLGMSEAARLITRCREIVMNDLNEIAPSARVPTYGLSHFQRRGPDIHYMHLRILCRN